MSRTPVGVWCIDRVNPTVAMTSPGSGDEAGVITVAAAAADNDRIASCQLTVDGAPLGGVITVPPYQLSYDTRGLVNGGHSYGARVLDRVGNAANASPVGVTVRNAPVINFYSPGNGVAVANVMTLAAYVTQYSTGVSVYFYIDGSNIYAQGGPTGYFSVNYDTHYLGLGWHTITCIAVDNAGNQSRVDYSVYVNNATPAAGVVSLGDMQYFDDNDQAWYAGRFGPEPYDGTGGNWRWSATQQKFAPVFLPGNPDPAHYQMRVWMRAGPGTYVAVEGGSDGNVVVFDIQVGGIVGWTTVWQNGPQGNVGPLWNVGGGNDCYMKRWCTWPGNNNCKAEQMGFYYDFVPIYGS